MTARLHELPRERTQLLDNLGWIRRNLGPVTPELSDALADHMNIRRGEVAEVASFYSYLRLPADVVRVCTGPVCDCLGGRDLLAQNPGAVEVPCIGHCDLAPAMLRGDEVVPAVTHATNHGPSIDLLGPDEPRDPAALEPDRILAELEASGLVGYGGAGFPTFRKWAAVRDYPGPRVVIVNADEGEPGTIKDRYVMELRPHLLVEGIEIALRFAEAERRLRLPPRGVHDRPGAGRRGDRRPRSPRHDRHRRRLVRLRRGDRDAGVDGGRVAACRGCARRSRSRSASSGGRR